MSMRRRVGATLLGAGLLIAVATAQEAPIPAPPAGLPPPPAGLGVSSPAAPGGTTIWSLLGINQQQREFRQQAMARTPLGDLRGKIQTPLSKITGGIVPEFPPKIPTKLELEDPGVIGKGAKLKQDRAGAIDRIKAIKELGTADCHYWPEAEDGLIEALRVDRNEWVRLAAAEALSTGCCCTKKTIAALTNAASCSTADDHPAEKSPRVVAAACAALQACLARVCTNPAVMAAPDYIPPAPPVTNTTEEKKDEGEGETKPAAPKGPGTEKGSGTSVRKLTGKEYYARVGRLSWNQVIVPAKMTLAQGPRIPAELALTSGYDSLGTVDDQTPSARAQSVRPANLLDMALGNPPAQPQQVMVKNIPPAPHIPYAVMQVKPTVPQQMPTAQPIRQANQYSAAPAPTTVRPMTAPVATPRPVLQSVPVPVPATTAVKPVSATVPAPVVPAPVVPLTVPTAPVASQTEAPRSIKVCELLTKNADFKSMEAELDKVTASDCNTNPALVPCVLKYALEGSEMNVRMACVRLFARCKTNTPAVQAGLEKLVSDRSVELRVEAAIAQSDLKAAK